MDNASTIIEERVVKIQLERLIFDKKMGSTNLRPTVFSQIVSKINVIEIADMEKSDHHVFFANLLLLLNRAFATILVSLYNLLKSFSDIGRYKGNR